MSATKNLTEQTQCLGRGCPQGKHPHEHYDIRYCWPKGGKVAHERLDYWLSRDRPEGVWTNCPACWMLDSYVEDQLALARKHMAEHEKRKVKRQVSNGRHKGAWELTLTYSPSWYQDDAEAQAALRLAVDRLTRYYKEDLEVFRAVGEFTKDNRAHLHCFYRLASGGKITDKNLKRAYPHWNAKVKVGKGNQGGHHAPVVSVADYSGYIEKDLETSWFHMAYPSDAISEVQANQA